VILIILGGCDRGDQVDTTVARAVEEGNLPLHGYKDVSLPHADDDTMLLTPRC
jgi:hypothetical protein